MYCKNCGAQIEDGTKYCIKCGKSKDNGARDAMSAGNNKVTVIVTLILTIIVALSPFMKMYYIELFEQKDFSVSGMIEATSEIFDFGKNMGVEFHLSDIKVDEMSDEAKVVFFVVVFDMIMFVIGFAEILAELIYIVSNGSEGKFWKAVISSATAFFIANLIIFLAIWVINTTLNNELGQYNIGNIKIMGVHVIHYFFQAVAVITYFVAHLKYNAWKKTQKNS